MSENTEAQGSELSDQLGGALEESLVDTLVTKCESLQARVKELEGALVDARCNLTAEGHDESIRIYWALNDINCVIN